MIPFGDGSVWRGVELDQRAYCEQVLLHFIELGKPIQNSKIESFNRRLRAE